jgi:hypothetical protein
MAERSRLWTTNGTGDGVGTGYTVADWQEMFLKLLHGGNEANGGVLLGVANQLAVSGAASPLTVATGAAMVHGFFYANDTPLNLTVTTPVVGTTGGRIVLRVNWAAQTVRAVAVRNTDGVNSPPALTQTVNTTWEVSLATFTITTGGVITVTDTRVYSRFSTQIVDTMIRDGAITTNKYADASITAAKLAVLSVAQAAIQTGAVGNNQLANNAVDNNKLAAGAALANLGFTPWHSGNDGSGSGLDADRIKNVDVFFNRQGGNAANWSTPGAVSYAVTGVRMQFGVVQYAGGSSSASVSITFPTAFGNAPLVFFNFKRTGIGGTNGITGYVDTVSNTGATILFTANQVIGAIDVQWHAIGL